MSTPCDCTYCHYSRTWKELERAYDLVLDDDHNRQMGNAHLRDEVQAVISSPWSLFVRKRLRRALEVSA